MTTTTTTATTTTRALFCQVPPGAIITFNGCEAVKLNATHVCFRKDVNGKPIDYTNPANASYAYATQQSVGGTPVQVLQLPAETPHTCDKCGKKHTMKWDTGMLAAEFAPGEKATCPECAAAFTAGFTTEAVHTFETREGFYAQAFPDGTVGHEHPGGEFWNHSFVQLHASKQEALEAAAAPKASTMMNAMIEEELAEAERLLALACGRGSFEEKAAFCHRAAGKYLAAEALAKARIELLGKKL